MSAPILYYFPPSVPCRAVMLLAQVIGLSLDLKLTNLMEGEQLKPDFIKMNPVHTVPTLDDNGFYLGESRAIMTYLTDSYAKNDSMYPKDLKIRAMVDQRMQFDLGVLYKRTMDYYFTTMQQGTPPDETKMPPLKEALGFLDLMLMERSWVAADQFTVADVVITVTVSQLEGFGMDLKPYGKVTEWLAKCKAMLEPFGYKDINQSGVNALNDFYKSQLKQ